MKEKLYNPSILNNLYDGLYIVDKDKRILFWNISAEKITGYSHSEVIKKPYCSNILMHIDGEGNNLCTKECPIDATLKDSQIREVEVYIHHKDSVLKMVSKTLVNGLRASDVVVRWGGEEIIAILSGNLTENKLEYAANKLRILVEKSCLHINEGLLCVTVSGGGTLAKAEDTIDSLIKRVDQLMYQSKHNGRNLITIG